MKDRYKWDPNKERILDMKYKKSYGRINFKEIFKILAKTEQRKEDLRKMASKSELSYQKTERQKNTKIGRAKTYWKRWANQQIADICNNIKIGDAEAEKEIRDLEAKVKVMDIDITFLADQNKKLKDIIEKSATKAEMIKKAKEQHLMGEKDVDMFR